MNNTLTLIVCTNLVPEFSQVIENGDYPDVKLLSYNSLCDSGNNSLNLIDKIKKISKSGESDVVLLTSNCFAISDIAELGKNVKTISMKQCFEPFLNSESILHFISKGYYLASPGWLRQYDKHIKDWGFTDELAKTFFGESMDRILFLDTKLPGDYIPKLKLLSEYMNLPYEMLPVGLDKCKLFIDSIVLEWRYDNERKFSNQRISSISQQSSDLRLIMDQLELLVTLADEEEIIDAANSLLNLLFAPNQIRYIKYENETSQIYELKEGSQIADTSSNDSFYFDVYFKEELLGKFEIYGLSFPNFIEKYKAFSSVISKMLGISIANARKYKIILEQNDQIQHYSKELQISNRTKDMFFSIIAHDLRSPFSAMLGLSELLVKDVSDNNFDKLDRYSKVIHNLLQDTFNLLSNLLSWSQTQSNKIEFKPKQLPLIKTVIETNNLVSHQAEAKNISIVINIPEDQIIYSDENMLKTILRNLISNAIKFSNKNGKVILSSRKADDFIELSIKDEGIGMSEGVIEKLFIDELISSETGTSGEKGTGLGLILCKEFVELHKGEIIVESKENIGSTFKVLFPFK